MGKVSSSDAFDILVKDDRKLILKQFGNKGLARMKDNFLDIVATTVDIDNNITKVAYNNAVVNGAF